jgi:transposase
MDMHTSEVTTDSLGRRGGPRRRWPEAAKRKIVEETFEPGASVAIVARRYELNANVVFAWRRLYRAGETSAAGSGKAPGLIPVKVIAPEPSVPKTRGRPRIPPPQSESIEMRLADGTQVRFSGGLAREALRQIIAAVCAR